MNAPHVASLDEVRLEPSLRVPALPNGALPADAQFFVVTRSGRCLGRTWRRGDVLVCRGAAAVGAAVVLVARGLGRPRLGRRAPCGMQGDAGEPCSEARWHAAGRIATVLRPAAEDQGGLPSTVLFPAGAPSGWALIAGLVVASDGLSAWDEVDVCGGHGAPTEAPAAVVPLRGALRARAARRRNLRGKHDLHDRGEAPATRQLSLFAA